MDDDTTQAAWNQKELDERRRRDDELMAGRPEYAFPMTDVLGKKVRVTFPSGAYVTGRLVGADPVTVETIDPPRRTVVIGDFEAMTIYPEGQQ